MIPAAALHRLVVAILGPAPSVHTVENLRELYDLTLQDLSTLTRVAAGEGIEPRNP